MLSINLRRLERPLTALAARATLAILALAALAPASSAHAQTLEPVRVQLKWKHQFQFAGYYAAIEQGYYREGGFEVSLLEPAAGANAVDAVLTGRAEYGIGASELALRRGRGEPLVAVAVILQHSPLVLLAGGGGAKTVHDLADKRVMLLPQETELFAYLAREGLPRQRIVEVPHSFDVKDLIEGRVAALSAYSTDEVWSLQQARVAHSVFSPRAAGIDFYGDTLFTSETVMRRAPARVEAFRQASLRGWRHAMQHPEETADLILRKYGKRHSREHLLFEAAEMRRLMQPELVEIGHMNPARWRFIAGVYAELGMLPANAVIDGLVFDATPRPPVRGVSAIAAVWATAGIGALAALLLGWRVVAQRAMLARNTLAERQMLEANERLRAQLQDAGKMHLHLEDQMIREPYTGLYTRRYFEDVLRRELARAAARNESVAVILAEIRSAAHSDEDTTQPDPSGIDLAQAATAMRSHAHATDVVCRWGLERFALLIPEASASAAWERALAIRASLSVPVGATGLGVTGTNEATEASAPAQSAVDSTASAAVIGAAMFPRDGRDAETLIAAAERALEKARGVTG